MTSQIKKLVRLWYVSLFIGTLARKNEKLARLWHVDAWVSRPRWHVWHEQDAVQETLQFLLNRHSSILQPFHFLTCKSFFVLIVNTYSYCGKYFIQKVFFSNKKQNKYSKLRKFKPLGEPCCELFNQNSSRTQEIFDLVNTISMNI